MDVSASEPPLLAQLLADLLGQPPPAPGEDGESVARRWLSASETGMRLTEYLMQEAGLLAVASSRLQVTGDQELTEIGRELRRSAQRLSRLAGGRTEDEGA